MGMTTIWLIVVTFVKLLIGLKRLMKLKKELSYNEYVYE